MTKKYFLLIPLIIVVGVGLGFGAAFGLAKLTQTKTSADTSEITQAVTITDQEEINETVEIPVEEATQEQKTEEKKEEAKPAEEKQEAAPAPKQEVAQVTVPNAPAWSGAFQWGVTMRPSGIGNYNAQTWAEQVNKAKELGVGWARIVWDYENASPFVRNTQVIDALKAQGINVMLVIEQNPATISGDNYQQGYNDGKSIASYYKGKVSYYQLANEGSAQVINGGTLNGQERGHYNSTEYHKLLTYLKGLSAGISAADPGAKKMVSMVFTHVVYLDMLKEDGLNYDIIGVDWYDWMGPIGSKKLSNGTLLMDKLKSFGKPLMYAEINILPGVGPDGKARTAVDEDHQASFIIRNAQYAWDNRDWFKGFYVLELVDNVNNPSLYKEFFGLIKAEIGKFDTPRKAFYSYKDFVRSH